MLTTRLCSLLLVVFAATAASAHGDEHHGPPPTAAKKPAAPAEQKADAHKTDEHVNPHGGQVFVLDAADHIHAEVVFHAAGIRVWLYDADMKPLPLPAAGKGTVVVDKAVTKLDLAKTEMLDEKPDAHLAGAVPLAENAKAAVVLQLVVNGKARTGRIERVTTIAAAPTSSATHH